MTILAPIPVGNYDVKIVDEASHERAKLRITSGEYKGRTIFVPEKMLPQLRATIDIASTETLRNYVRNVTQ